MLPSQRIRSQSSGPRGLARRSWLWGVRVRELSDCAGTAIWARVAGHEKVVVGRGLAGQGRTVRLCAAGYARGETLRRCAAPNLAAGVMCPRVGEEQLAGGCPRTVIWPRVAEHEEGVAGRGLAGHARSVRLCAAYKLGAKLSGGARTESWPRVASAAVPVRLPRTGGLCAECTGVAVCCQGAG
jgi:hypothetical protein